MSIAKFLQKLTSRNTRGGKTRHQRKTSLRVESLEDRRLFVVGAAYVPDPLPLDQLDGVVSLTHFDGAGNATGSCSGTLLSSGKHILTAAHCITDSSGRLNVARTNVTFRLSGRDVTYNVLEQFDGKHFVHPAWDGTSDSDYGADLAVLQLPEVAPVDADRYELYRGNQERGQIVQIVGYGRTGEGNDTLAPDGNRRMMRNTIEGTSYDPLFGGAAGPDGTVLWYDFDSTLGSWEGMAAPGDSGGPVLLNGQIAGINSAGWETAWFGGRPDFEFGEDATATRVQFYADWIEQQMARDQVVTLNMSRQLTANDGTADQIEMRTNAGRVEILVNGRLASSTPQESVILLFINGTNDAEQLRLTSPVNVRTYFNGGSGSDTLVGANTWNNWTITRTDFGGLNSNIVFTSVENLTGGTSYDEFRFSTNGFISGRVSGGAFAAEDRLDYSQLTTGVTVDLARGTASRIGGGIQSIQHVTGGSGDDVIRGNELSNVLLGNDGVDFLYGRDGNDWLFGGDHDDRLFGDGGIDHLYGNDGNDYVDGGHDRLADYVFGNAGNDTIIEHQNQQYFYGSYLWFWDSEDDTTDFSATEDHRTVVRWNFKGGLHSIL